MAVNKHAAMQEWLKTSPALPGTLLFDFLGEEQDAVSITPVVTEEWVKRYSRSNGIRKYTFQVQVMLARSASTDTMNTDNMAVLDAIGEWIEAQQAAQNFPDFGPGVSDYTFALADNMGTMMMSYENGFAKYGIAATVSYFEQTSNY